MVALRDECAVSSRDRGPRQSTLLLHDVEDQLSHIDHNTAMALRTVCHLFSDRQPNKLIGPLVGIGRTRDRYDSSIASVDRKLLRNQEHTWRSSGSQRENIQVRHYIGQHTMS